MLKDFLLEVFSCFSRLLNVLGGGTADITLSARSHRYGPAWLEKTIDWFALTIFGEVNHCQRWWEHEVLRSQLVVSSDKGFDNIKDEDA